MKTRWRKRESQGVDKIYFHLEYADKIIDVVLQYLPSENENNPNSEYTPVYAKACKGKCDLLPYPGRKTHKTLKEIEAVLDD